MDSRRPTYPPPNTAAPPPPPHPPSLDPRHHHHHQHQQHHQQPPYPPPPPQQQYPQQQHHPQQQQHPHHGHPQQPPPQQAPPQPAPGPPPPLPPQQQQHPPQQQSYRGAPLPPPPGPALPPIQPVAHAQPATSLEQQNLPSFRHPSAPPPHDQREGGPPEYYQPYNQHNRSGHATPAPVNRSYSHDSGPQRSPATPAGPGPGSFPPGPGHDGAPPPPPGHPPPHQMDHGGHHGYPPTNGNLPHGLPPPQPQHQHHEQFPPPQPTPIMDNHYSQYPPPSQPPMYGGTPYNGPASAGSIFGAKRKQMRATQACEQCRARKQKCDEGSPCSFCKENGLSCQYRDTPPAKTDKNMEKLLHYMEAHSDGLKELTSKIDSFEQRLRRVEQHNAQQNESTTSHSSAAEPAIMDDREPPRRKPELDDHRTAPHKLLLLWPSVRPLLRAANVEHNDGYVMEAEDRGVLRLWTRGEGIDENDGTQPGGPASPARSDESGEGAASTPHADGLWGHGFPSTPNSEARRSEPYGAGGLKANGEVDLDAGTINMLYDSYMRHIHIMHPFLDKRRLRKMFDNFIKRYSTGKPRAPAFAVANTFDSDQRPLKRQRSNGSGGNVAPGSDHDFKRDPTERSPGNAIIYLVMALGKICLHREPLPAVVADSKLQANSAISHQISGNRGLAASSPMSVNIKPSPMSPKSTPTTQPTPPSDAGLRLADSRSRRSSVEGGSPSAMAGPRNMDVIPGIAYYAKAAEILGDQGDGNDLVHAQMFLLAGLYKGQLARVKESMSWITMAGRAILILLDRYKLYNDNYWTAYGDVRRQHERAQKRIKDTRQSLIVLASWTCLQLESDILAELRLPSSGIQNIENLLLMPHKVPEDETYSGLEPDGRQEDYDNILIYYTAQLFLRRRLNQVHREMYGPECLSQPLSEVQEMLLGHENILTTWREGLPPLLRWNDSDPPSSDILAARLRAKYYGARYIINRPFLDYALHIMPGLRDEHPMEAVARDGYGNPRDKADVHLFRAIENLGESIVWQAARRCVDAAMHSTIAFDGVPDRLIITNIHGTAHAQFGNMLVLCATFTTDYMKQIVQTDKFRERLHRTIGFLRKLAPISPTCAADCGILEKFNNLLFPVSSEQPDIYHNEGVEPMSATNSFGGHST